MDKNTEFKWNDKLVQDYIQFYAASYAASVAYFNSDETLEKFKQSKSKKEEPQWEILEFKNLRSGIVYIKKDNGKFNSGNGLDWDLEKFDIKDHEIINSVKRFPDNTVWSVDDDTQHGKITAFKITGNTMIAEIKHNAFPYDPFYLSELKAPKEQQVPIKVKIDGKYNIFKKGGSQLIQFETSADFLNEKMEAIKSAIEDVLNSETLESIKKKYEDIIKEINREAAQKIFDINNNARNQFS